jgi:hypothetical protein
MTSSPEASKLLEALELAVYRARDRVETIVPSRAALQALAEEICRIRKERFPEPGEGGQ